MDDWDLDAPPAKKKGEPAAGQGSRRPASAEEGMRAEPAAGTPAAATPPPGANPVTPEAGAAGDLVPARARHQKLSHRLVLVLGALVVLLIGALAGFYIARSQAQHTEAELARASEQVGAIQKGLAAAQEVNWSYHQENESLKAQIAALQQGTDGGAVGASTTTTVPGRPATYTDGIYRVGTEIKPGDYDGVVTASVGYWARLRGTDGLVGSIVTNGLPTGPFVLTVNPSDVAVELRGVRITAR